MIDLTNLYHDQTDETKNDDSLPRRLLAPEPYMVPASGLIEYRTVETVADVLGAPHQSVLLIPDDKSDLLECVVKYHVLFGFVPFVLSGLPTADYTANFESKTYNLERVSFESLTNEMLETSRVVAAIKDQNATPYDKEKQQYTRKSGLVKELTGAKVVGLKGAPDQVEPADDGLEA